MYTIYTGQKETILFETPELVSRMQLELGRVDSELRVALDGAIVAHQGVGATVHLRDICSIVELSCGPSYIGKCIVDDQLITCIRQFRCVGYTPENGHIATNAKLVYLNCGGYNKPYFELAGRKGEMTAYVIKQYEQAATVDNGARFDYLYAANEPVMYKPGELYTQKMPQEIYFMNLGSVNGLFFDFEAVRYLHTLFVGNFGIYGASRKITVKDKERLV